MDGGGAILPMSAYDPRRHILVPNRPPPRDARRWQPLARPAVAEGLVVGFIPGARARRSVIGTTGLLAAIFDGGKGAAFLVILVVLLVVGTVVLVLNLSLSGRPRAPASKPAPATAPPAKKWEAVADDEEGPVPEAASPRKPAPRRRT